MIIHVLRARSICQLKKKKDDDDDEDGVGKGGDDVPDEPDDDDGESSLRFALKLFHWVLNDCS